MGEVKDMDKRLFGCFVAENRREQGLTQKMLAEQLHVTDKAVSKWERGLSYPDVTMLEPLAAALGMEIGELVSCRRKESVSPESSGQPEALSAGKTSSDVKNMLDISSEIVRRERTRRRRGVILLSAVLLALVAALALLWGQNSVAERGILTVIHIEEQDEGLLLYTEKDGHLLRLTYDREDRTELARQIGEGYPLRAEYRWNRKTMQGRLLRWEIDRSHVTVGGPMDEVGASTDLQAYDGDALFGCPRVMVKTISRRPNPVGNGYLSDYIFYRGNDSADWYLHADEELFRVKDCLGFGGFGDGGFRTADADGDGIRELLVRTRWPEKPCILYDWTDNGAEEIWLDTMPEAMMKAEE